MQMYSNHDESVGERICFGVLYYDSDVIVDKTRLGWADRTLGFEIGRASSRERVIIVWCIYRWST